MEGTPYCLLLAWAEQIQATSAASVLSTPAIVAVAAAAPITIFVIVVGALVWRSPGLPPAGQAHTLKLLDRLAKIASALWPRRRRR